MCFDKDRTTHNLPKIMKLLAVIRLTFLLAKWHHNREGIVLFQVKEVVWLEGGRVDLLVNKPIYWYPSITSKDNGAAP